jgi:hypothetical protein
METGYGTMSNAELEALLKKTQSGLDDAEDEQTLILEQSKSGQHMSSAYFQSRCGKIERKIEGLKSVIEEIRAEMEKRKDT